MRTAISRQLHSGESEVVYDSQTGIPYNCSYGARCVQRLDDSQIRANRITFRISLRSSSLQEPRDPLLKVVILKCQLTLSNIQASMWVGPASLQTPVFAAPRPPSPLQGREGAHRTRHRCAGLGVYGAMRTYIHTATIMIC